MSCWYSHPSGKGLVPTLSAVHPLGFPYQHKHTYHTDSTQHTYHAIPYHTTPYLTITYHNIPHIPYYTDTDTLGLV